MKRFDWFMPLIIQHEGGFVNNILDSGGATKYGISLRFLKSVGDLDGDGFFDGDIDHDGDVDVDDIRLLTPETVSPFYLLHFYNPMKIDKLMDEELALQLFDFGVNAGTRRAVMALQALIKVKPDGLMGPTTVHYANSWDPNVLSNRYRSERMDFYRYMVKKKPSNDTFLAGWLRRAVHCNISNLKTPKP